MVSHTIANLIRWSSLSLLMLFHDVSAQRSSVRHPQHQLRQRGQRRIDTDDQHLNRGRKSRSPHHRHRSVEELDDTWWNQEDENVEPPPFLVDPKSCRTDKGKTCTPSAAPSWMPSARPTVSHMPTISMMPSAPPSISKEPSAWPSPAPSVAPSTAPSHWPSPQPSAAPSPAPTISAMPSVSPSHSPTQRPTTAFPTYSAAPTQSPQPSTSPSVDPNGFVTRIITDATGQTGLISECRNDIPATVTDIVNQAVIFDYEVQVQSGSDVFVAIDYIATQLHQDLSQHYLECQFPGTTTATTNQSSSTNASSPLFYIQAFSSLPTDILDPSNRGCTATATNAECYRVDAAYLAKVFYMDERRRYLQSEVAEDILDSDVLESFSSTLKAFFSNTTTLSGGMSSILGTSFQRITNTGDDSNDDAVQDDLIEDDTVVAPVTRDTNKSLSPGAIAGTVIGTVLGAAILIALMVCCFLHLRRRRRDRHPRVAAAVAATKAPSSTKGVDVTHGDNSYFTDLVADPSEERDDRAMLPGAADRSYIASDDGSEFTGSPRRHGYDVAVVLDDEQSYGTNSFMFDYPNAYNKSVYDDHQDPSFVKTEEILLSLSQAEMKSKIRSELGSPHTKIRSPTNLPSRRQYGVPDTVQL